MKLNLFNIFESMDAIRKQHIKNFSAVPVNNMDFMSLPPSFCKLNQKDQLEFISSRFDNYFPDSSNYTKTIIDKSGKIYKKLLIKNSEYKEMSEVTAGLYLNSSEDKNNSENELTDTEFIINFGRTFNYYNNEKEYMGTKLKIIEIISKAGREMSSRYNGSFTFTDSFANLKDKDFTIKLFQFYRYTFCPEFRNLTMKMKEHLDMISDTGIICDIYDPDQYSDNAVLLYMYQKLISDPNLKYTDIKLFLTAKEQNAIREYIAKNGTQKLDELYGYWILGKEPLIWKKDWLNYP